MTPRVAPRSRRFPGWRQLLVVMILAGLAPAAALGQDPPPPPTPLANADASGAGQPPADAPGDDPAGGQLLTRGPVHEAFASPIVHDPVATPVVAKDPPAPIQEMPPDQKPAGQNIQWIPGYWGWDVSRNDYIWVSGVWREPPPNNQWVPGYWNQVEGGHQWVPGTWVPIPASAPQGQGQAQASAQGQPAYLPPPPASLESGPNTPQPGPNTAWTPGYWYWQGSEYAWRPGFWSAVNPNWIWIPAHYVWTPSGYLFVAGYWDLPMANRGLMFAPVYYPTPVYAQAGFAFTPSVGIVGTAVTGNLFVQASTNQYLFGNYYGQNFVSVGISPWFSFTVATGPPVFYDPLFSFYAVVNVQQNPRWVAQVREQYVLRRDNVSMRPPVTYVEQTRIIERNITINRNTTVVDHQMVGMPLSKMATDPAMSRVMRLERVDAAERAKIQRQAAQIHEFRQQRAQQEREGARERAAGGPGANRPRPMNLPHSPIAAHPAGAQHALARRNEEAGHNAHQTAAEHERAARQQGVTHPQAANRARQAVRAPAGAGMQHQAARAEGNRPAPARSAPPRSRVPAAEPNRERQREPKRGE